MGDQSKLLCSQVRPTLVQYFNCWASFLNASIGYDPGGKTHVI